jgi:tetratricopeptide (TPR) repeat protein
MEKALWCIDMTEKLDCDHFHMGVIKGHILLANQKEAEAEAAFAKVLQDSGNNPKVRLRIIISYHDNKFLHFAYNAYLDFFKTVGEDYKEGYAYLALCCNELMKNDEFLYYLKKACDCNPEEARAILGEFFPSHMDPKDYYQYALEHTDD